MARSAARKQEGSWARVHVEGAGRVQLTPRPAPGVESFRCAPVFGLVGAQTREHQERIRPASATDASRVRAKAVRHEAARLERVEEAIGRRHHALVATQMALVERGALTALDDELQMQVRLHARPPCIAGLADAADLGTFANARPNLPGDVGSIEVCVEDRSVRLLLPFE